MNAQKKPRGRKRKNDGDDEIMKSLKTKASNVKRKRKQRGREKRKIYDQVVKFYEEKDIKRSIPHSLFEMLVKMTEYELRGMKDYEKHIGGQNKRTVTVRSFMYTTEAINLIRYATERYFANLIYDAGTIARYSRGKNKITFDDLVAVNNIYRRHGLPHTLGKFENDKDGFYEKLKSSTNPTKKKLYNFVYGGDDRLIDWNNDDMIGQEFKVIQNQNTVKRKPYKKKIPKAEQVKRQYQKILDDNKEILEQEMKRGRKAAGIPDDEQSQEFFFVEGDEVAERALREVQGGRNVAGRYMRSRPKFQNIGDEEDIYHNQW